MINFKKKAHYTFEDVMAIIHLLRSPGGCPWDQAQTHTSIRRNFLEETYEACEAIDRDDPKLLCEELGDVLTQVVFHTDIEAQAGRFTMEDVCDSICTKMIRRHPHLFPGEHAEDTTPPSSNWDELKMQEKGHTTHTQTLQSVATTLPALWRSDKLHAKARKAGFGWDSPGDAWEKLSEEVQELAQALKTGRNVEEELGDVLFAAVCVAGMSQVDPEQALHQACEKFIHRFSGVETALLQEGKTLRDASQADLLALWDAQK